MPPMPASASVEDLLERVRAADIASDATLILGLLLEDPAAGPDNEIAQIVGSDWAARRLSATERFQAIRGLVTVLQETVQPSPQAVSAAWALGKSLDPDVIPVMTNMIDRFLGNPDADDLLLQLIQVVDLLSSYTDDYNPQVRRAMQAAVGHGPREVARLAQEVLHELPQ